MYILYITYYHSVYQFNIIVTSLSSVHHVLPFFQSETAVAAEKCEKQPFRLAAAEIAPARGQGRNPRTEGTSG